jgi:hypothetical protein
LRLCLRFQSREFVACRAVGLAKADPFAVPFLRFLRLFAAILDFVFPLRPWPTKLTGEKGGEVCFAALREILFASLRGPFLRLLSLFAAILDFVFPLRLCGFA